jgi:uncharacterized RDD family membrane protein YckC
MAVESRYGAYRNFWRRFWGGMVDGLIFHPLTWIDRWAWHAGLSGPTLILWFIVANSVGIAYEVILHGLYGQTLGKKLLGVRVCDVSGGKLSMRQAMLRSCFPIVVNGIAILVDLPKVAGGVNPYDPETFSFASATVWQLMLLWSSLAWLVIELLTMFSNPRRRALHDFIARSVVTRVSNEAAVPAGVPGGA